MSHRVNGKWSSNGSFSNIESSDPPLYENIARYQPVFAPIETTLGRVDQITTRPKASRQGNNLRRKVEAAARQCKSFGQTGPISSFKTSFVFDSPAPKPISTKRKNGLAPLRYRLSKIISIKDEENVEKDREVTSHPASLLSHKLVGAASPYPMRPSLSEAIGIARMTSTQSLIDCPPSYPVQAVSSDQYQEPFDQ